MLEFFAESALRARSFGLLLSNEYAHDTNEHIAENIMHYFLRAPQW
jgi:hypothetical protein